MCNNFSQILFWQKCLLNAYENPETIIMVITINFNISSILPWFFVAKKTSQKTVINPKIRTAIDKTFSLTVSRVGSDVV